MPNLIFLGNFSHIKADPTERNWNAENANDLVGISADSTQMSIVNAAAYDYKNDGVIVDDDYGTCDYIKYNVGNGSVSTFTDASMTANVKLTLSDGSVKSVEVVMIQQQNGDLFISDLQNCGTLDNLSIANVEITGITNSNSSGWHVNQSVDNTVIAPIEDQLDGTVSGTSGDDVITVNYTGDPDGDRIDAGDAVLPGAGADDDLVEAGAGDDIVRAGEGDDVIYGDSGDDSLFGEAGDDTVFGGSGDDLVQGGAGDDVLYGDGGDTDGTTEFALDWDQIGSDGSQTLTVDGQSVKVSVSTPKNSNGHEWTVENGMLKNWDVVRDSTADISFDTEVSNVKFTLLDVDRLDEITIMAKDADGNLVEVDFEVTGVHSVNGNTVTGTQTNAPGPAANNSAQDIDVTIQGPIQQLWIVLDDGPERAYSGTVAVSDITFEIPSVDDGVDGNDTIMGGEGDDLIYGNGGDDVITGGTGDDVIYGDNGGNAPVGDAGRESFDWTGISDAQIDSTVTKDTGSVSVTYTRTVDTGKHISALWAQRPRT
ncbi:Ca2+-binding RTX toxin-like protein [Loktanella ponticola]|uniref:Ca2+-binding RTX toxin-like protein n=1 Tax=Yoonia ponticola TaxID=1524255 RepID=A0A7W9EZM6_9RHOB|nr:hypothetical protein [Yoonia ponticola]MBB5723879.1 Ca2+-binding RTX toxin-like protein [Yoonia ponticola]